MYTYRQIPNNRWREKLTKILLTDKPLYFMRIDTTGLNAEKSAIIGISILKCKWQDGRLIKEDTFDSLIHSTGYITPFITELTGITHAMLMKAPDIDTVMDKVRDFLDKDAYILAFNTQFLGSFLKPYNLPIALTFDMNIMSQALLKGKNGYKYLVKEFGVNSPAKIFECLVDRYPKGTLKTCIAKYSKEYIKYDGYDIIDEQGILDELDPDVLWEYRA